jgi:hypothetical protein
MGAVTGPVQARSGIDAGADERPRRLDLTPVNDNAGLAALIAEAAADARCSAYLFAADECVVTAA